jgi:RHS repeat-associated protein
MSVPGRVRSFSIRRESLRGCCVAVALSLLPGLVVAPRIAAAAAPALADATAGISSAYAGDLAATLAVTGSAAIAAGRTPGSFGVSQSGAATYRIPLWMPPGVGAVELEMALLYNSRAGNGLLGQGWSLSGLSAISRCNKTWAQDGHAAGVSNTLADRICLDGQQLKLVSGSYGMAGSVYATEIETFSRIVATGTLGNGPASFTLTTKNGLIYEYGTTTDSRLFAGSSGTVRTWALARIRDRAGAGTGNSIGLTYANDAHADAYSNGTHRIASISYPTTATGQGPFYTVSFGYSARPASDVPSGYLAGHVVREPNRLDSVTVHAVGSSTPIKSYYLGYAQGPASGRLRLDSVQECAPSSCLRPTTIAYQDGARGWMASVSDTTVASYGSSSPVPLDLNGDGLTDILYPVSLGNGNLGWRILLATGTGYAAPLDTTLITDIYAKIIPGQFVGNGRNQFLIPQGGYWYVAGIGTTGFNFSNTGRIVGGEYGAADFDGDGLADLMSRSGGLTSASIAVRRNTTTPSTAIATQFAATSQTIWTVPSPRQSMPFDNLRVADLNGDGRADIIALSFTTSTRNPKFFATPLLSNGFEAPFTVGTERLLWQESMVTMGDWNADGCSDVIQVRSVFVSDCAGSLLEIATGSTPATGSSLYTAMPADWNGDGRTDLLYIDAASKQWYVVASTGHGAAAPVSTGIKAPASTAWFVLDADGDGLTDIGYRDGNNGNRLKYHLHAGPAAPPDLATRFTDGFGMQQAPTYVSIARSHHTRSQDATFPEADFQAPLYVVNQFAATDGTGGTYQNKFHYYGARIHLQGRGFEGFLSQRIEDSRNGLVTLDYAHRQFPYTGMHIQRSVYQPGGFTRLRDWRATVGSHVSGGTGFEQRRFPFIASALQQQYEAGGPLNGSLVTESSTTYVYGDGYGNLTQAYRTTTDKDPYSPYFNVSWMTSLSNKYSNDVSANWCLGLLASTTKTSTISAQVTTQRTTAYASDPIACRTTQQTIEPANPTLRVVSTLSYDGCGNLSTLRVIGSTSTGSAMPARTTTFGYGNRCQLLESATNAMGHTTSYLNNHDFGLPTRATDPNGLTTSWQHDEFGRRTLETRPDQTRTAWAYESCATGPCWGVNDLRFLVYETRLGTDGSQVRQRQLFYDGFERLRYREYHRALGTWTNEVFAYDAFGRLTTEYRPYSSAGNGYTTRAYDVLDRVTAQRDYDGGGALRRSTVIGYSGRTVNVTDPLGRTRSRVFDVAGHLRRLVDPAPGGTTHYDYDAVGNLVRIQDPIGAISLGSYNARGFRIRWADADAGTWNYSANSLNELTGWTDAKSQSFSASYDLLGRMVSRTEPEGTNTWTWGSLASARNIGQLAGMSGYGYNETRSFDATGRLASRTITTDQSYQYDYTYNSIGELDTVAYPASPVPTGKTAARFRVRYGYSFGAPSLIEDVTDAPGRTLWSLVATNDYSSVTAQTLAGGAIYSTATFDPSTNEPTAVQASTAGTTGNRQSLAYRWDAAGNLTERRDLNQNLAETFLVDALDRITRTDLNGVANLAVAYNAAGNITHRSDLGWYSHFDPARPHAVTAAGTESRAYDGNGNVRTINGQAQTWASFNLPVNIVKGGYQTRFAYGPDRQRWRQVADYQNGTEITHYVGQLLEKESTTSTGLTYWRHYVPTPSGASVVVSRNSDSSTATSYLLKDHLGSSDTLLDETGAVTARLSFSAMGVRRGSDWKTNSAPDWLGIANTTRHGFTGHEMLDNVGLVHMNGRVYDPKLGRFLSVDPVIGNTADSQAINAYAYVGNRPLVSTDPTGLVAEAVVAGSIFSGVGSFSLMISLLDHRNPAPPPATAIPGQSAQSGVGMCGPGTFSPTCSGMVLYAGPPSAGSGGLATSSWGATSVEDQYARDNLEQFFIDLGVNSVDVLILGPIHDAADAYHAAQRGEYVNAGLFGAISICNVAKFCQGLTAPFKALKRSSKAFNKVPPGTLPEEVANSFRNARYRTKVLREDVEAYRYSGGISAPRGRYLTTRKTVDRINSPTQAKEALNLPSQATAEQLNTFVIPKGTTIHYGRIEGGSSNATQIFLEDPSVLK